MEKKFEIYLRRRVPFLSQGLWDIIILLSLILFLLYIAMLPTEYSSQEMSTVYYLFIIPDWLKKASSIALIGSIVLGPLYFALRLKKAGFLVITPEALHITVRNANLELPVKDIKRIYFNDLHRLSGVPRYKLQIAVEMKSGMTTLFQLKNYLDAEDIAGCLGEIAHADFLISDRNMITMHDDE
jgi:hypothetical protein